MFVDNEKMLKIHGILFPVEYGPWNAIMAGYPIIVIVRDALMVINDNGAEMYG